MCSGRLQAGAFAFAIVGARHVVPASTCLGGSVSDNATQVASRPFQIYSNFVFRGGHEIVMTKTREEILQERRRLRMAYGELDGDAAALLFRHDPIGINFDTNPDEYEPEVGTILPKLRICESASDVLQVVHEEFVRWFGPITAGPKERYVEISAEIWQLWQSYRLPSPD